LPVAAAIGGFNQSDPVAANGKGKLAMLQRQSILTEDPAAPTVERRHGCIVVHGDCFEVVRRGHQLLRDLMLFTALLQQHAEQFDQRAKPGRGIATRRSRRLDRPRIGETALNRFEDLAAQSAFGDAFAEAAGSRQSLDRLGDVSGDLEHRLVSHDAAPRQVALPGSRFAPGRHLAQNAEEIREIGSALYKNLLTMHGRVERLGSALGSAVNAYNEAVTSLDGRVLTNARKLHELKAGTGEEMERLDTLDLQTRTVSAADWATPAAETVSAANPP